MTGNPSLTEARSLVPGHTGLASHQSRESWGCVPSQQVVCTAVLPAPPRRPELTAGGPPGVSAPVVVSQGLWSTQSHPSPRAVVHDITDLRESLFEVKEKKASDSLCEVLNHLENMSFLMRSTILCYEPESHGLSVRGVGLRHLITAPTTHAAVSRRRVSRPLTLCFLWGCSL